MRYALVEGLHEADHIGVNPFKLGIIALDHLAVAQNRLEAANPFGVAASKRTEKRIVSDYFFMRRRPRTTMPAAPEMISSIIPGSGTNR